MNPNSLQFRLADRSSKLPLYLQIEEDIRRKIHNQLLLPGDKIPSEEDLAKSYRVSRMTARRAITELTKKGLLYQRAGIGTFVTKAKIFANYTKLTSFTEDAREQGKTPQAELITLKKQPADEAISDALMIKPDEMVICVERLRKADDLPVSIQCSYVPEAICPSLYNDIQQNYQSLNALLNSYGLQMVRGIERISTALADALQADLLDVRVGEPLLYIERITFDESGVPVEFIKTYNRPDRYNCTIVLVR